MDIEKKPVFSLATHSGEFLSSCLSRSKERAVKKASEAQAILVQVYTYIVEFNCIAVTG